MPRARTLLPLAVLLAAACSERAPNAPAAAAPDAPGATTSNTAPAPPPKLIPDHPPSLPDGSVAIRIIMRIAPAAADSAAAAAPPTSGWLEISMNDTRARVPMLSTDSPRSAMEALARVMLDDGWTLHLEPGTTPDLYLYLPPGPVDLNTVTQSSVPGVSLGWNLGAAPPR
jgi:hypothetical protein